VGAEITGDYSETFRVKFVAPDGLSATDVDAYNAVAAFNTILGIRVLTKKSADKINESPLVWDVTNTYTVPKPGVEAKPSDPDVQRWAIDIQFNPVKRQVEIQRDITGAMILNSAGDPIANVSREQTDGELVISFTSISVDWIGIDAAYGPDGSGCVNSVDLVLI